MRKILSLFFVFALFFLMTVPCSGIKSQPVYVSVSEITEGCFTVEVLSDNIYKLTNAVIHVKYDPSVFSIGRMPESDFDDGLWEFGELYDKSGYAAALVSPSGVSKKGECVVCSFEFLIVDGYSDNTEIEVVVKEFVTDDNAFNDIFYAETLWKNRIRITDEQRFSFLNGMISGYNFHEKYVIVPSVISGVSVTGVDFDALEQCNCVLIFANGSQELFSGGDFKYLLFSENCKVDLNSKIVFTDEKMCSLTGSLFLTNCSFSDFPTFIHNDNVTYGTGSVFLFNNYGFELRLTLSVSGDVDGDGVFDVVDICEVERFSHGNRIPTKIQFLTADVNCDMIINTRDFVLFYSLNGEKIIEGDIDGDCYFDVIDIVLLERALNGHADLSYRQELIADINCDSEYNAADYSLLVNLLLNSV